MNKEWKVTFKKLPDETVIDTMMPVMAPTEDEARRLSVLGITMSNLRNENVKEIEIVSCVELG